MLFLVLTVVIVMAATGVGPGDLPGLWARLTGRDVPPPPAPAMTSPRPMSTGQGMQQVERTRRDLQAMDSLANSVRR